MTTETKSAEAMARKTEEAEASPFGWIIDPAVYIRVLSILVVIGGGELLGHSAGPAPSSPRFSS